MQRVQVSGHVSAFPGARECGGFCGPGDTCLGIHTYIHTCGNYALFGGFLWNVGQSTLFGNPIMKISG